MVRNSVISKVVLLSGLLLLALCLPATAKKSPSPVSVPDGDPASLGLLGVGMLTIGILQQKRRTAG